MAANNFATKLSRNTNRITLILIYTFLEWLLMFFIFLNSLLTYFTINFASFFGLKQICLLCPKVDRFTYKELLCKTHLAELCTLSYCKTHEKLLSESLSLCSDCSDRDIGLGLCTCCQKSLVEEKKPYPSYLLVKSSIWGKSVGDRENGGLILEMIDDDKIGDGFVVEEGKRPEENGEVISDVESYGLSLREVSEEDGLRLSNKEIHTENVEEEEDDLLDDQIESKNVSCELKNKSFVVENVGFDETLEAGTKEEEEEEDLLDDQIESKNVTCKLKDESFVVENVSVGFDETLQEGSKEEEEEEEEEKTRELLETPTSMDKKLSKKLVFEDGNVDVEMEGDDPIRTIERLKETVKAEQEALRGLYLELEEERSASAIAANQTMAMITRLQEEKAKVQMEALQYQRMMEEQAEYDQEALQLLNHLMVKREKEKEELQRELEVYKAKISKYDGDKEEENVEEEDVDLEKITLDCVKHMGMLDESLSEFEEERLVILDQLKVLEDRLLTIQDKESGEFSNSYEHEGSLTMSSMAKSLLPLLDAAAEEDEESEEECREVTGCSESEKVKIIKQVDSVYERLQVLESDGEFLESSGTKGDDKGTDLLQDILQHLRDLRNIELAETMESHREEE